MCIAVVLLSLAVTSGRFACAGPPTADFAPSARAVARAIDAYLGPAGAAPEAVAPTGYEGGFALDAGARRLLANVTIQARYEAFLLEDHDARPSPGGQLSGFSLARTTLRLSTEVGCGVRGFVALEFGHPGDWFDNVASATSFAADLAAGGPPDLGAPGEPSTVDYGTCREAWVEVETGPALSFRAGTWGRPRRASSWRRPSSSSSSTSRCRLRSAGPSCPATAIARATTASSPTGTCSRGATSRTWSP